ncbi:TetR family transcriptional regulator [Gordonia humi]|uniref:AcrR family transcriptional regulator n=1 Tax=Gordonia humi TaxID=686429 RepID=A0A840EPS7_9ACTN|nr:AcrR family transcriptional regulator [Gordonia humi]
MTVDRLPRGPHGLEREDVLASQRRRIFRAALDCVAENGFAGTSIAAIVAGAGVSRRSFYELFADKVDCVGAALDFAYESLATLLVAAFDASDSQTPRDVIGVFYRAYLEILADRPSTARALHVELPSTAELASRRESISQSFAARICETHRHGLERGEMSPVDPGVFDFVVGGVDDQIRRCILMRGPTDLPSLAPLLTHSTLMLLGDHRTATSERSGGTEPE